MRGEDLKQEAMFSYLSAEQRVPVDYPLRPIRQMVDTILKEIRRHRTASHNQTRPCEEG